VEQFQARESSRLEASEACPDNGHFHEIVRFLAILCFRRPLDSSPAFRKRTFVAYFLSSTAGSPSSNGILQSSAGILEPTQEEVIYEFHQAACARMHHSRQRYGAAQTNGGALAPLQVPAKTLAVPTDVSPEMQKIIAAPRNSTWNVLWKTGEEWRAASSAQAAKTV
jgi:hypothetical protein